MNAYFAGGCFWCMAKPYDTIPGVTEVVSGYCGGSADDAVYEKVKQQETMHRETVRIAFDPAVVSFSDLLEVYFYNIDPFDDGGQFIDRGRSYTCAVYWTDNNQKKAVQDFIARVERETGRTVCVSLEPFRAFYPAEEYHQDYAHNNPEAYREEYVSSGREGRDNLRAWLEKPLPRPYPSWDEVVSVMYGHMGKSFDKVLRVLYDDAHEHRFILLRSAKGYIRYNFETLRPFDEDEWVYFTNDRDALPGFWNTNRGTSLFDTEEEAMRELVSSPEYRTYFAKDGE